MVWSLYSTCPIFTGCKDPRRILFLERGLTTLLGKFKTNKTPNLSKSFQIAQKIFSVSDNARNILLWRWPDFNLFWIALWLEQVTCWGRTLLVDLNRLFTSENAHCYGLCWVFPFFFFNFLFFFSFFTVAGQNITVVPVWEQNMECVSLLTKGSQMNSIYSSLKISS